jgi:integrase
MADLVKSGPAPVPARIAKALVELAEHSIPKSTRRTYLGAWRRFRDWAIANGRDYGQRAKDGEPDKPASAETLCLYVAHLTDEGNRLSTVHHALAAIHAAHGELKLTSERNDFRVKKVLRGLGRMQADRPPEKKKAITVDLLEKLVLAQPDKVIGVRDKAILLVGFSGAFRRSELVALTVEDITWRDVGIILRVKKSKTDQTGQGALVEVFANSSGKTDLCPVRALKLWLNVVAKVSRGPIFREILPGDVAGPAPLQPAAVCDVVKRACELAGLDPDPYGAHSLRAGFITSAAEAGKPLSLIMQTSRHKSHSVAQGYVRHTELLKVGAGKGLLER